MTQAYQQTPQGKINSDSATVVQQMRYCPVSIYLASWHLLQVATPVLDWKRHALW